MSTNKTTTRFFRPRFAILVLTGVCLAVQKPFESFCNPAIGERQ